MNELFFQDWDSLARLATMMVRSDSKTRRRIDPQHPGDAAAVIDVSVRTFGTKIEAVALTELIATVIDGEFDDAVEDVAEFLALVLQGAAATAAGLDVVDVAGEQV